jgi:hypothetical protein
MHDDDIDSILSRAFPQGYRLLQHENGTELLRHSARSLIGSPQLAYEILGAKTTKALGQALLALGERYVKCAERLLKLAAAEPSRPPGAPQSMEPET